VVTSKFFSFQTFKTVDTVVDVICSGFLLVSFQRTRWNACLSFNSGETCIDDACHSDVSRLTSFVIGVGSIMPPVQPLLAL
jgi:hypothetical protein